MKESRNVAKASATINDIPAVRQNEEIKRWFRSDRFIIVDQKWYFTTRENRDVGPFKSRADAEHGLQLFIECIINHHGDIKHAISVAIGGDWVVSLYR
jgi:hypothetical protein